MSQNIMNMVVATMREKFQWKKLGWVKEDFSRVNGQKKSYVKSPRFKLASPRFKTILLMAVIITIIVLYLTSVKLQINDETNCHSL